MSDPPGWQPPSGDPPQQPPPWQPQRQPWQTDPLPPQPPQPQPQPQWQTQTPQWQQPGQGSESSGKAVASLVLGICGLVVCPIILSIVGLVLGYQARGEIKRSGGRLSGDGQARAGIILGWVGLALWLVFIAFFVALGVVGGFEDTGYYDEDFSLLIPR